MRLTIAAGTLLLAISAITVAPAQARQGGTFMWCTAWTEAATDKAYFYSGFFAAEAWQAERKAFAFKVDVEKAHAGIKVKSTCMPPADHNAAVATRNAAMKAAPGKILNWEG